MLKTHLSELASAYHQARVASDDAMLKGMMKALFEADAAESRRVAKAFSITRSSRNTRSAPTIRVPISRLSIGTNRRASGPPSKAWRTHTSARGG